MSQKSEKKNKEGGASWSAGAHNQKAMRRGGPCCQAEGVEGAVSLPAQCSCLSPQGVGHLDNADDIMASTNSWANPQQEGRADQAATDSC